MYNYYEEMKKDVKSYIEENEIKVTGENQREISEKLYDVL